MSNKNSIWVCLEQTNGKIASVSYEMLSQAKKLSSAMSGEVCAVLLGRSPSSMARTRSTSVTTSG